jgi:hypothetical protein
MADNSHTEVRVDASQLASLPPTSTPKALFEALSNASTTVHSPWTASINGGWVPS